MILPCLDRQQTIALGAFMRTLSAELGSHGVEFYVIVQHRDFSVEGSDRPTIVVELRAVGDDAVAAVIDGVLEAFRNAHVSGYEHTRSGTRLADAEAAGDRDLVLRTVTFEPVP